jgi:hypothetical protein
LGTRGKAAAEIRQLRGELEVDPYLLLRDGDSFFCVDEVTFSPNGQYARGKISGGWTGGVRKYCCCWRTGGFVLHPCRRGRLDEAPTDYSPAPFSINLARSGWNIGAGAEFMLAPQWSATAEYNFLDFGKDSLVFPLAGTVDTQVHEFKVGVNYHWVPGTLFGRW